MVNSFFKEGANETRTLVLHLEDEATLLIVRPPYDGSLSPQVFYTKKTGEIIPFGTLIVDEDPVIDPEADQLTSPQPLLHNQLRVTDTTWHLSVALTKGASERTDIPLGYESGSFKLIAPAEFRIDNGEQEDVAQSYEPVISHKSRLIRLTEEEVNALSRFAKETY